MSDAHGVARDQLRAFISRIERLEEEKKTIADDIKDVYGEAKSMGFDTKAMKKIVALRKMDDTKRTEEELILDTYKMALGMIPQMDMFDDEQPETANEIHANPEEEGAHGETVSVPSVDAGSRPVVGRSTTATSEEMDVTGGESAATSCEYCDDTGDVHRIDGEWLGFCHCEYGKRLQGASECEIAPASQGEAEAPSVESTETGNDAEDTRSDANTGGSHVTASPSAATHQAGGVSETPAAHSVLLLRPHCQRPGKETCGGSGSKHCRECAAAMREEEVA